MSKRKLQTNRDMTEDYHSEQYYVWLQHYQDLEKIRKEHSRRMAIGRKRYTKRIKNELNKKLEFAKVGKKHLVGNIYTVSDISEVANQSGKNPVE